MRLRAKFLVLAVVLGCGPKAAPPAPQGPTEPASAQSEPDPITSLVTSMVMVDECPESKKLDSKLTRREIDELVGPCKKVPGGAAHFAAILKPGGQVELAAPSGDPAAGVVPTCLLQQATQLRHKIRLKTACKFDVRLEERAGSQ